MKIGFIGIGVMGRSMAENLIKAGHDLTVYTRTAEKAAPVVEKGATWKDSVASCVSGMEAVITMVGYPADVEEVYFGSGGVIENAAPGAILADMTTTSPNLSVRIYDAAKAKGLSALDAPVSGGDSGAKNGTLSVMVGGDREVFDRFLPVFEAMGKQIVYEGGAGKGQHTKMCNQIAIAGAVAGVCEAVRYGEAAGLDMEAVLGCIGGGAAASWQLSNNAPKMLKGDFAPGFYIKHYIKDMRIAMEEAGASGLSLTVLPDVLDMYEKLAEKGMGDLGTQALIEFYK